MTKRIKSLLINPLFSGSLVMIIGINAANLLAYFYHLIFGRILGPVVYSELAVIISLTGLMFALLSFFSTVIVKFVSSGDKQQRLDLYTLMLNKFVFLIVVLAIILTLVTPFISNKLDLPIYTLIWIGPTVVFMFLSLIHTSFLQGTLKFNQTALLIFLNILLRLAGGLLLYFLGFSLSGIAFAIMFSYIVTWLLGKKWLNYKVIKNVISDNVLQENVFRYAVPVFVTTLSMAAFVTLDILLARYFLEAYDSGIYASLSTLGKIIYFGAFPVTLVMFPLVSKEVAKDRSSKKLFFAGFALTLSITLGILFVFWLFPNPVVNMLFGSEYLSASSLLTYFGVFSLLYTLNNYVVSYFLSSGRTSAAYLVPIGLLIQMVGVYLKHDTISDVIRASIIATLVLFIMLVLYGFTMKGKPKPSYGITSEM